MSDSLGQQSISFDSLVSVLQQQVRISSGILAALQHGVGITSGMPVYSVATLPTTAATGAMAFASNGRKGAEGAGAGTGVPVFWNPATSTWFSALSGALVLA